MNAPAVSERSYQTEAVDATFAAWARGERTVVALPTGVGKPVIASRILARLAAVKERKAALDAFRGRRIHLLGGTWARALSYLYLLGDDVVSMDMNSMQLLAKSGLFVDPAGETHHLKDTLPFSTTNTLAIAFAISCGSIQHALDSLVHAG